MRRSLVMCLALAIWWSSHQSIAQGQTPLEGAWRIEQVASDGQTHSPGVDTVVLTFAGLNYNQAINGTVNEWGTIKLDQTKKPSLIDFVLTEPNVIQRGVFEINGDELKLHVNRGTGVRPMDF